MKWFRHFTKALTDPKIEKLIMRHGIEGYGLYFACLEIIAGNLTSDNITFELEHDAEILAYKFKIDTLRVEAIMKSCIELGLFEYSKVSKRIQCIKMLDYIDETSARNPEIKKIVSNYKQELKIEPIIEESCQNYDNSGDIRETLGDIPKISEQIRLDQIRLDKKESIQEPPISEAYALPPEKVIKPKKETWYSKSDNADSLRFIKQCIKEDIAPDYVFTPAEDNQIKIIVDLLRKPDDTFDKPSFGDKWEKYMNYQEKRPKTFTTFYYRINEL